MPARVDVHSQHDASFPAFFLRRSRIARRRIVQISRVADGRRDRQLGRLGREGSRGGAGRSGRSRRGRSSRLRRCGVLRARRSGRCVLSCGRSGGRVLGGAGRRRWRRSATRVRRCGWRWRALPRRCNGACHRWCALRRRDHLDGDRWDGRRLSRLLLAEVARQQREREGVGERRCAPARNACRASRLRGLDHQCGPDGRRVIARWHGCPAMRRVDVQVHASPAHAASAIEPKTRTAASVFARCS